MKVSYLTFIMFLMCFNMNAQCDTIWVTGFNPEAGLIPVLDCKTISDIKKYVADQESYIITLFSDMKFLHEGALDSNMFNDFQKGLFKSIVRVSDLHELTKEGFKPIESHQ